MRVNCCLDCCDRTLHAVIWHSQLSKLSPVHGATFGRSEALTGLLRQSKLFPVSLPSHACIGDRADVLPLFVTLGIAFVQAEVTVTPT